MVNFGGPEGPVSQIHYPHLHTGAHGIFSDLLRSVQFAEERAGCGKHGKLPQLFISSKTATLVPEFAVEGMPLKRTASLVSAFAFFFSVKVKNLFQTFVIGLFPIIFS